MTETNKCGELKIFTGNSFHITLTNVSSVYENEIILSTPYFMLFSLPYTVEENSKQPKGTNLSSCGVWWVHVTCISSMVVRIQHTKTTVLCLCLSVFSARMRFYDIIDLFFVFVSLVNASSFSHSVISI